MTDAYYKEVRVHELSVAFKIKIKSDSSVKNFTKQCQIPKTDQFNKTQVIGKGKSPWLSLMCLQ